MHDDGMASSRGPDAADEEAIERVAYPVESPFTATFDPLTGALTLESMTHRCGDPGRLVRLRLDFSPETAYKFVRLLKAVEKQLGITIADSPGSSLLQ